MLKCPLHSPSPHQLNPALLQMHTAVKIEPVYRGPVVHVLDASRSVPVAQTLLDKTRHAPRLPPAATCPASGPGCMHSRRPACGAQQASNAASPHSRPYMRWSRTAPSPASSHQVARQGPQLEAPARCCLQLPAACTSPAAHELTSLHRLHVAGFTTPDTAARSSLHPSPELVRTLNAGSGTS